MIKFDMIKFVYIKFNNLIDIKYCFILKWII